MISCDRNQHGNVQQKEYFYVEGSIYPSLIGSRFNLQENQTLLLYISCLSSVFTGKAIEDMYARWMILFVCCRAFRSDSHHERNLFGPGGGHETVHGLSLENSSDATVTLGEEWPTAMSIRSPKQS